MTFLVSRSPLRREGEASMLRSVSVEGAWWVLGEPDACSHDLPAPSRAWLWWHRYRLQEEGCAGVCPLTEETDAAAEGLISTQRAGRGFLPRREAKALLREETCGRPRQGSAQPDALRTVQLAQIETAGDDVTLGLFFIQLLIST